VLEYEYLKTNQFVSNAMLRKVFLFEEIFLAGNLKAIKIETV
jgi:hypothetical protein